MRPITNQSLSIFLGPLFWISTACLLCGQDIARPPEWKGVIRGFQEAEVAFTEGGVIRDVLVRVGQSVAKDEPLANLESELQAANLKIARQQAQMHGILDAAEAEHELALLKAKGLRELAPELRSSPQELLRAEAELNVAAGRLLAAQEELKLRQLEVEKAVIQLERRTLRAPFAGVVSSIHHRIGENVAPLEPKLIRLISCDQMIADIFVDAKFYGQMKATNQLSIRSVHAEKTATAEIMWIAPALESGSSVFLVSAQFANVDGAFLAGDQCYATLPTKPQSSSARLLYRERGF